MGSLDSLMVSRFLEGIYLKCFVKGQIQMYRVLYTNFKWLQTKKLLTRGGKLADCGPDAKSISAGQTFNKAVAVLFNNILKMAIVVRLCFFEHKPL